MTPYKEMWQDSINREQEITKVSLNMLLNRQILGWPTSKVM